MASLENPELQAVLNELLAREGLNQSELDFFGVDRLWLTAARLIHYDRLRRSLLELNPKISLCNFRIGSDDNGFTIIRWGESREEFAQLVSQLSELFGPPDDVHSNVAQLLSSSGKPDVDLLATWNDVYKGARLKLYSFYARGCKLHPDAEPVTQRAVYIHPECDAALKELLD